MNEKYRKKNTRFNRESAKHTIKYLDSRIKKAHDRLQVLYADEQEKQDGERND